MNPFSLEGKKLIVTGASSGIGRQCAISCSQMGAKIILLARNEERLKETFSNLHGDGHLLYSLDITELDKIESVIKDAVDKVGKMDGFIHSAGIEKTLPLKMMTQEIFNDIFKVNVFSGFEFAKILSKKKYRADTSSFVFISSIMSIVGQPGKVGYCSSKSAIIGAVKAIALELASKNVRANSVSPAVIQTRMGQKLYESLSNQERKQITDMHPLGLGSPEDVANACIYLLSDAAKWVTGTNLIVDGGYSAH